MFDAEMLAMLRCPHDRKQLEMADAALVERLNGLIERRAVRDRIGQTVTQPIEAGLVAGGGRFVYPIRGGIATLVIDEAMVVEMPQEPGA